MKKLYIKLFITIVLLILVFFTTEINKVAISELENRSLAQRPVFDKSTFFSGRFSKEFDAWLNDRFRGRYKLITLYEHFERCITNRIDNDRMFEGNNGFLFYKGDDSVENYQNKVLFTDAELSKINKNLEQRKQYLNNKGISFFVVIAPDKNRVYGENYPSFIHKVNEKGRAEQLVEYLSAHGFDVIYPLQELLSAKKQGSLYYRLDTHWNTYAAFIAYDKIMKNIIKGSNLKQLNIKDFKVANEMEGIISPSSPHLPCFKSNDLIKMANIPSNTLAGHYMETLKLDKCMPYKYQYIRFEGINGDKGVETINTQPLNKFSFMMFRDSFAVAMEPYFSETFAHSIYIWDQNFNMHLKEIETFRPNIVVEEVVERLLPSLLWDVPPLKEVM